MSNQNKTGGIIENKEYEAFAVKSIDVDKRQISAIASTGNKDRDGDIILPSAFKKSLPSYLKNPIILASHCGRLTDGHSPVVGKVVDARIDSKALHVIIQFAETELGEEYWKLYSQKIQRALSVGFIPVTWKDVRDGNGRRTLRTYTEVELLEISCVAVPSNREALSKSAKKRTDWLSGKKMEREAVAAHDDFVKDLMDADPSLSAGMIREMLLAVDDDADEVKEIMAEDPLFEQKAEEMADAFCLSEEEFVKTYYEPKQKQAKPVTVKSLLKERENEGIRAFGNVRLYKHFLKYKNYKARGFCTQSGFTDDQEKLFDAYLAGGTEAVKKYLVPSSNVNALADLIT